MASPVLVDAGAAAESAEGVRVAQDVAIASPCTASIVSLPACAQGGCPTRAAVDWHCAGGGSTVFVRPIRGGDRVGTFLAASRAVVALDERARVEAHGIPASMATPFMNVEAERNAQLWLSATSGTIPATLTTLTLERGQWTARLVDRHPRAGWVRGLFWRSPSSPWPQFYLQIPYAELVRFDPPSAPGEPWRAAAPVALQALTPQLAPDGTAWTVGWTAQQSDAPSLARWTEQQPQLRRFAAVAADRHADAPQWLAPAGRRAHALVLVNAADAVELHALHGDRDALVTRWLTLDAPSALIDRAVSCSARRASAPPERPYIQVSRASVSLVGDPSGRAWVLFERRSGVERVRLEERCYPSSPGDQGPPHPCDCRERTEREPSASDLVVVDVSDAPRERWVHAIEGGYGPVGVSAAFSATNAIIVVLPLFRRDQREGHRVLWLDRARL
ncbi:MAG: hypothetical protein JNK05_09345 [Myxococcales bacterium]|nr:hypothetical protein [Myxococcales bacterium]